MDLGSIENGDRSDFSVAFDYVQTHTYHRVKYGKLWRAKEWLFRPREFQRSLAVMDNVVYAIIRGRENDPVETLKDNTDVLSQLMYELRDEESYPDREKHLRDFIMNFLIAGRDTTAMLLTWTFHLLAEHPEVEQKCLEEIEQVLGDDELTWDNVKACKYIKMVLQETLRMYPPVPVDGYAASEDEVFFITVFTLLCFLCKLPFISLPFMQILTNTRRCSRAITTSGREHRCCTSRH